MDNFEGKREHINFEQAMFLIGVAILFDILQIFLVLFSVLLWWIVGIVVGMMYWYWYHTLGVQIMEKLSAKVIAFISSTFIEMIPILNLLPWYTPGVMLTIYFVRKEDADYNKAYAQRERVPLEIRPGSRRWRNMRNPIPANDNESAGELIA